MIAKSVRALAERYDPTVVDPPLDARVRLAAGQEAHDALLEPAGVRIVAADGAEPDALIVGSPAAWRRAANGRGGLAALGGGLQLRRNLHVAAGFLAATSGDRSDGRLRLETVSTSYGGIATAQAGSGPALLAIHGLGGTKASFLPTLALMGETHRVIAVDLPGFGDSAKPLRAPYDAPYFAGVIAAVLDELGLDRAHVVGNSMGGRIALELALTAPERVDRLVLLLAGMRHRSLFVWGRHDRLVPIGFMKHVERTFPAARHLELECGHVPQVEKPVQTHEAMRDFLLISS